MVAKGYSEITYRICVRKKEEKLLTDALKLSESAEQSKSQWDEF